MNRRGFIVSLVGAGVVATAIATRAPSRSTTQVWTARVPLPKPILLVAGRDCCFETTFHPDAAYKVLTYDAVFLFYNGQLGRVKKTPRPLHLFLNDTLQVAWNIKVDQDCVLHAIQIRCFVERV